MASVTLVRLRSDVYDRLDQNTDFFPTAQVNRAINNAIKTLNLFTGFSITRQNVTTLAGTGTYAMPSGVLVATGVKFGGRPLAKQSFFSLIRCSPRWQTEISSEFGSPVSTWSQLGIHLNRKLILHPAPEKANVTVEVEGVAELAALVADGDTISIPSIHTQTVVSLAAHELAMKCGGLASSHAMVMYQEFLRGMKEARRFKSNVNPRFWIDATKPVEAV